MSTFRQYAGLIAAVVVAAFGAAMVLRGGASLGGMLLGDLLVLFGMTLAVLQARLIRIARGDPYDLSRLWEREPEPEEEADEDAVEDEGTLYCHSCGHAVPRQFHVCPECRRPLT